MRILILGAGGTGGYFGGRLVEAGCDVTFAVRPARAARLRHHGLVIRSPLGDARLSVAVVEAASLGPDYDLVVLGCKAYDLADAIQTIAPAMQRPGVALLPLLNGLAHFDALDHAFGATRVLGGLCHISATLDADGEVIHLNRLQSLTFGERQSNPPDPSRSARIAETFARASFESRHSQTVVTDLWEKFAFMAAGAALTCLMRASVGDIVATAEGAAVARQLVAECGAIAAAAGHPVSDEGTRFAEKMLTRADSPFKASMLRDIEAGGRVEADHLIGDMLWRGRVSSLPVTLLATAFAHLKAYERQQASRGNRS